MTPTPTRTPRQRAAASGAVWAALTATLMLGACASSGDALQTGMLGPEAKKTPEAEQASLTPKTELEKATEYWGKKYKEHPDDLDAAISYVKNLKAMGERQQAMAVVQQASVAHGNDKKLASEYGRLALELDQISIAKQMLAMADDPAAPDWRVISARGTVAAKEGKFDEAIPLYERALLLSQEQTSVMNNLAMAYAMAGEPAKAEEMLRRIGEKGGNPKMRQNLALVLGLQGKFDEARAVSSQEIGAAAAASDTDYLRRMVKTDKASSDSRGGSRRDVANAAPARATIKPAVADPAAATWDTRATKVADALPGQPGQPMLKGMSP